MPPFTFASLAVRTGRSARWALAFIALASVCTISAAQGTSSQITGRVVDATGATIPGGKVTVTNQDTQIVSATQTNSDGLYTVPQLAPGRYKITVSKEGFASAARSGVTLVVDQIAQLNFTLATGSVSEVVQVTGDPPLLSTSDPTASEVIGEQQVASLPLNGRSPYRLVLLTPGIHSVPSTNGQFGDIPVNTTDDTLISIDGGPASANEVLIDGIPTTSGFINQLTTIPSVDATQEFDVQSGPLKAVWGRSGGGVINVYTKSGTNALHGVIYEFLRNSALDSNEYFNKRSGRSIPPFKQNQFGFAIGGPVFIPKLYDGRDKNFFFVDYQGTRWRQGQIYRNTLPTAAQRMGDFSHTFDTQGRLIQIYNPFSTRTNPSNPTQKIRDPFPGNMIPKYLLNPVSVKALDFVPQPNTAGDPITNTNNYISNANRMIDEAEFGIKLDQSINSKERLFERFSFNRNTLGQPDTWGNAATPDTGALGNLRLNNTSAGLSSITTLNASTVLTTSYGFARFYWARPTRSFGFDQSQLGFPSSFVTQQAYPLFPSFNIAGFSNIGGGGALLFTGQNTHSLLASLVKSVGRHTLSFGVDTRLQLFNQVQGGDANGTYTFAQATTAGPNPNSFATFAGSGFASFLLGTPTSGQVGQPAGFSLRGFYYAGYIQDEFHITPKLTLSYGFRYDATSPFDERRNQLNYFDPTLPSPARNAQFPNLVGGLVFASDKNRTVYNWTRNGFQPRFGFSYNPFTHTVVKGGIGQMYMPLSLNPGGDGIGFAPNAGFSSETPMIATLGGDGVTPFNTLTNPFPGTLVPRSGTSLGASTFLGQTLNVWRNSPFQPNVWQWNFGLQHQIGGFLLDALYEGSKGSHLTRTVPINALPDAQFALGSALQQQVSNPFYGIITAGALSQPTVARRQLLLPYPQYTGVNILDDTSGSSIYHALAVKLKKDFSHGATFLVSYTLSKEIADVLNSLTTYNNSTNSSLNTSIQNPNNLRAERSVSELDVPQALSINYVAQLPFGRGRRYFSGAPTLVDALIGGWQSNAIFQHRSGYPLVMSAVVVGGGNRPNKTCDGKISGSRSHPQQIAQWFNTSCFTVPPAFTFGNDSRVEPSLRGPQYTQVDFGLEKSWHVREITPLFRAEAFNILNNTHFFQPNTTAGSLNFGQITATTGGPRVIQFAVKMSF